MYIMEKFLSIADKLNIFIFNFWIFIIDTYTIYEASQIIVSSSSTTIRRMVAHLCSLNGSM